MSETQTVRKRGAEENSKVFGLVIERAEVYSTEKRKAVGGTGFLGKRSKNHPWHEGDERLAHPRDDQAVS